MRKERTKEGDKQYRDRDYKPNRYELELLYILAQYYALRTTVWAAFFPNRQYRAIHRNVRRLRANGYIEIPREYWYFNTPYAAYVYCITQKGEAAIKEEFGQLPLKATPLIAPNRPNTYDKQFPHAMMICDITAYMHIGAGDAFIPYEAIASRWDKPNAVKLGCTIVDPITGKSPRKKNTVMIFDNLVGLRQPDGKVTYFAIEAERSDPTDVVDLNRASWRKKTIAYQDIFRRREYLEQLGITNMRVLAVFKNATKMQSSANLTEGMLGPHNGFLFGHIELQEDLGATPKPETDFVRRPLQRAGKESVTLLQE